MLGCCNTLMSSWSHSGSGLAKGFMLMQPSMGTLNSPSSRVVKDSNLEVNKIWDG